MPLAASRPDAAAEDGEIASTRRGTGGAADPRHIPTYLVHAILASEAIDKFPGGPNLAILVANAVVFMAWQIASDDKEKKKWMEEHFMLCSDPKEFKPCQLLLHGFSQNDDDHIGGNMSVLLAAGSLAYRSMSKWKLFPYSYFYVLAIFASSLFNEVVYRPIMNSDDLTVKILFFKLKIPVRTRSLGASGAVSAVLAFSAFSSPKERLKLRKTDWDKDGTVKAEETKRDRIESTVWFIAASNFLTDLLQPLISEGKRSCIGHGSHIGGGLFGASVYVINHFLGIRLQKYVHQFRAFFMNKTPVGFAVRAVRKIRKTINKAAARFTDGLLRICCHLAAVLTLTFHLLAEGVRRLVDGLLRICCHLAAFLILIFRPLAVAIGRICGPPAVQLGRLCRLIAAGFGGLCRHLHLTELAYLAIKVIGNIYDSDSDEK